MTPTAQVRAFHEKFAVPHLDKPGIPEADRVRLRLDLITEEYLELLEAAGVQRETVHCIKDNLEYLLHADRSTDSLDLPAFADACQDLKYVILGAELEFGLPTDELFNEVHAANMRKAGGGKRDDGKIMKPDGWEP